MKFKPGTLVKWTTREYPHDKPRGRVLHLVEVERHGMVVGASHTDDYATVLGIGNVTFGVYRVRFFILEALKK